jgi:hypothetical protein
MLSRRLDDRIRHLSDQAVHASGEELDVILPKLLAAIHEKMERLRGLAANRFFGGRNPSERRALPPYLALNNIVTFLKFYATLRLWETRRAYGVIFRSWRSGGC